MAKNGQLFLEKVLNIINEESGENTLLIQFKHPKELKCILDLNVSKGVSDNELELCIRKVLQYSVKTNKSTFRNQLDGASDPYGLAGTWIAEAFNTSQYTYEVAPAFTLIEMEMLSHVLNIFGFKNGDGIFNPGGSISLLYALVAARYKSFPEVKTKGIRNLPEMIVFTSRDSHYSIKKATNWLGFGTDSIQYINTNDRGQMLVEELDEAIREVKENNKYPLMVNATAGTTVLGAIDDLQAIADICEKHEVWMHVDACWGGSLILTEKHKHKLKGIHRAQSISWNAHKMIGAPLHCSLFLIREQRLLLEANSAEAEYLFQQDKFYDVQYDTGDKSVQCGRKIDAFKLWVMWKARGDSGLASLVEQAMDSAQYCLDLVASRPGFRLVADELQCPNVCFWYIPTFMRNMKIDETWWDQIHKITPKIKELLILSSRLMVTYSPLGEHKNFFRMTFTCHPYLDKSDILEMIKAIEECGEMVQMD